MTASKVKNEVKNKHAINSTKASLTHSKYASVIDVPGAQLGSVTFLPVVAVPVLSLYLDCLLI